MLQRLSVFLLLIALTHTTYAQTKYDKAETFFANKQYKEARAVLHALVNESPRDERAWYLLSKVYFVLNHIDSAEIAARKTIELDDELFEAYVVLSDALLAKEQPLQAYSTITAAQKLLKKREFPLFSLQLGKIYLQLDSANASLVAFSKYAEDVPHDYRGYEGKGDAYGKQNLSPMAIMQYEKALEIDSTQAGVLYKLAKTYLKERQYTEAGKTYQRILQIEPTNTAARLELAELYYRAKMWVPCAATLRDYINNEKKPSQQTIEMYLEALYNARFFKDAFPIAETILKTNPKHPLALRALARGYLDQKQYQKSIDTYLTLEKVDTLKVDDYRLLGYNYRQLKKDSLAVTALLAALTTDSTNSELLGDIGALFMNMRKWDKAALYLEQRVQIDTTAVGAYINLASCLMQLEQYDKAIHYLQKAVELNPNYPPTYINIGFCYSGKKDFRESRKWFEKAIEVIDTAHTRYRLQLADAYKMIGLSYLVEKTDLDNPKKKWEDGASYLEKALQYKEDDEMTHVWLGQSYQNLQKRDLAMKHYRRALKLNPKNQEAQKGVKFLEALE